MIEAVEEGRSIDITDQPSGVVASGMTEKGLRVDLVAYDAACDVETPSEYDTWPDGPKDPPPPRLGRFLVQLTDAAGLTGIAGAVSWHLEAYGPNPGSHAWNIGIGLALPARGHGVGSVAQRLLTVWLLEATMVDRIEASTDVENVVEQRALERAGFTQEGILRSAQERADGRHDLFSYSYLRSDL